VFSFCLMSVTIFFLNGQNYTEQSHAEISIVICKYKCFKVVLEDVWLWLMHLWFQDIFGHERVLCIVFLGEYLLTK